MLKKKERKLKKEKRKREKIMKRISEMPSETQ